MFASYLLRVAADPDQIDPRLLVLLMNAEPFQTHAKSQATKSVNQSNINATKLKQMTVPVPPPTEQAKLVKLLTKLETTRAKAEAILADAPARKRDALTDGLR